jgi:hypothetical protein
MAFSDFPFAEAGPEGSAGQPNPAPGPSSGGALYRKVACDSKSVQLTPAIVNALPFSTKLPQSAIVTFEAANNTIPDGTVICRFWLDGTAPNTYSGTPAYSGRSYEIQGSPDLANMRIFSVTGDSHVLQIQYFSQI